MLLTVVVSLSASAGYRTGDASPALFPLKPTGRELAVRRLLSEEPTGPARLSWLENSKLSSLLAVYRTVGPDTTLAVAAPAVPDSGMTVLAAASTADSDWTVWGEASRDGSCDHDSAFTRDELITVALADGGWTGEAEEVTTCEHGAPKAADDLMGPPEPFLTINLEQDAFVAVRSSDSNGPTCGAALSAPEDEDGRSCDITSAAVAFVTDRHAPGACSGPACGDPGFGFDPLAEAQLVAAETQRSALATDAGAEHSGAFQRFLADQRTLNAPSVTREISHRIRPGETLSQVLDSAGIMPNEVGEWITAAQKVYDLNRVYAGQALSLAVDTSAGQLKHLSLEIDRRNRLVVRRDETGLAVSRESIPYETTLRVVTGRIDSSLYMAAVKQGIPERIVSEMAEILGWELDFARDLQPGATFRVVYEELTRSGGTESTHGRVLAVEVTNRSRTHEGIYFGAPDGEHGAYYGRDGEGLGRYFLRYPVEFTRISSKFSTRRFHPVLKRNKPHYGVDFAAPTGTPVRAIAAGQVRMAGWQGGNGNFIKIRHDEIYESGYAHLSRIDPAVKSGVRVKKGQVIGFVGATGLATGPHLHLALYRMGRYIDPLTGDLPHARPLAERERAVFAATVKAIDHAYAQAEGGTARVAAISLEDLTD